MEYRVCWIAYFDLLGFENEVRTFHVDTVLDVYTRAVERVEQETGEVKGRWFSDTFLFYTKDDSADSFRRINIACQSFFHHMITGRVPLRGCLDVGDMYIDDGDGILVGPALIEAYKQAEKQEWLGFVLTDRAADKIKQYDANGRTLHDWLIEHSYRYYDVPVKTNASDLGLVRSLVAACLGDRLKSFKRRRLLAYTMSMLPSHGCGNTECALDLYQTIEDMEHRALFVLRQQKISEDETRRGRSWVRRLETRRCRVSVLRKYAETKQFLVDTMPELRERVG
jgi:hypothetical protein